MRAPPKDRRPLFLPPLLLATSRGGAQRLPAAHRALTAAKSCTACSDPVECRFNAGWKCNQPSDGIVPLNAILVCSCANGVGTFANESMNCAPFPCPFPDRCLGNGTTCVDGATGPSCSLCSTRWYRWRDECRPCPDGVPPGIVLISVFAGIFVLWLGPKISKLTTPQAQAILKNLLSTFQYLSLSLTLRRPSSCASSLLCAR